MADHYMAPSSQDRHRPSIITSQPYSHRGTQGRPTQNPLENTKKKLVVLIAAEKTQHGDRTRSFNTSNNTARHRTRL